MDTILDELRQLHANEDWLPLAQKAQDWLQTSDPRADVAAEMAYAAARLDLLDQAERVARTVLQMDSINVLAMRTLALISMRKKNYSDALLLTRALFQPPFVLSSEDEIAQAILSLAAVHNALNESEKARTLAEQSIGTKPTASAYALLAHLQFRAGELEKSLESSRRSLELFPRRAQIWRLHATTCHMLNRLEDMFDAYENALKYEPDDVSTLASLGEWYTRVHKYAQAEELLKKAVDLQPKNAQPWTNLGKLYITTHQIKEGIAAFKAAYLIDPAQPEVLANMAIVHSKYGSEELALELMEKSYELNPDSNDAALALALHYAAAGQEQKSKSLLDSVLERDSAAPKVLFTQAKIAYGRKQYENGLNFMSQAIASELWFLKQQPTLELFGDAAPPYMDVYDASSVLLDACAFLESINVPYFLIAGTLLGIIRDGELLPHDKDMDLGIPWDVDREWLMDQIEQSEHFALNGAKRPSAEIAEWNFSFVRKGTPIAIDLFFFKPEGDSCLAGFYFSPHPLLSRVKRRGITQLTYKNTLLNIPENPEETMEELYGKDWRIPDPYFDSVVEGYSLCEESLLSAKIIGYGRLFEKLKDRSWKKVLGYCRALKKYGDDPVLGELEEWLKKHINS